MNRITTRLKRYSCLLLCLCLLMPLLQGTAAAVQDSSVVRVAWYPDSAYNITCENGERSGYGYEYQQSVAAYTGWTYHYIEANWLDSLNMLQKGEIDLMAGVSYAEGRAQTMLFSDLPMGEEKYYLYANLAAANISVSDLTTLNGKRIGMLSESIATTQFCEWETRHGLHTEHVTITSDEDAAAKIASREIDGFISVESPQWQKYGLSAITSFGSSDVYFVISKSRPDLKEALDNAMRRIAHDKPFYQDDLYQRYLSAQSVELLSTEEQYWLRQHGAIRIGFLNHDTGISTFDIQTGDVTGILTDYVVYATNCLGDNALHFDLHGFDTQLEQLQALQNGEIDLIFGKNMLDADAISQYVDSEKFTVGLSDPTSTRHIVLNTTHDILGDKAVRQALQHATNRQAISEGIFYGLEPAADTLYAATVPYCDVGLEPYAYDMDEAARLLDEAGWTVGSDGIRVKDGQKLALDLLYNSDSVTEKTISEYLQSEYLKLGISLNIHGEEEQSYRDNMKAGNFDMVFNICWGMPYDPQSSLAAMRAPVYGDYAAQQGLEDKAEIDQAITDILTSTDEAERQELYTFVLTRLHEDAVYIPLTFETNKALYTSDLKGVHFGTDQYDVDFASMYFA